MDLEDELIKNVRKNNIDEVINLIQRGADINYTRHGFHQSCLAISASKGFFVMVKLLLDNGANLDGPNSLALFNAYVNKHFHIVDFLLKEAIQ